MVVSLTTSLTALVNCLKIPISLDIKLVCHVNNAAVNPVHDTRGSRDGGSDRKYKYETEADAKEKHYMAGNRKHLTSLSTHTQTHTQTQSNQTN